MVFAYGSPAPDHRKHQEKYSCYLKPEHMQHPAYAAEGDAASPVKGPYPTILSALAPRYAQKRPALGAQIVGWHALTFRSALLPPNSSFYQRTIAGMAPIAAQPRPHNYKTRPPQEASNVLSW
jgi:hypothetical protein